MNLEEYDFGELRNEKEWRRCAPDTNDPEALLKGFIYFCETYWHIRHPSRGRIKFELFDAQIETVRSWLSTRYSLILKARQIGFSTLVAAYAYWLAFFYPDRPILMLSRTEREAIKLLAKAKYGRQFLPEWMDFRGGPCNVTQTKLEFTNGSYIESLPSASDPARGESAYLVVVDEMAFLPNSEEAWSAIEPVADVGGRVIMLSTANGEGNLFHKLWVEASTGSNRFTPLFFPWSANGRTEDWYESKKLDMEDWRLAQEYPDNADDAFLRSGRPVFDLEGLRNIVTSPPIERGYLDRNRKFVNDGGALAVWEFPQPNGKYVIGADPAQGLEHGDYSSAHVINARNYEVVATWHGHVDPDLFGSDILAGIGNWYNQALVGVESNNHGLTVLKALQQARYFPIYYERTMRTKRATPTETLGFRTTQVTKPVIIDGLAKALREIPGMVLHCANTVAELRTFTRDEKGKMSGSPLDDRTMSLAIANEMLKYVWMDQYQPKKNPPPGSWGDWERRMYGNTMADVLESRKSGAPRKPIGTFAVRGR